MRWLAAAATLNAIVCCWCALRVMFCVTTTRCSTSRVPRIDRSAIEFGIAYSRRLARKSIASRDRPDRSSVPGPTCGPAHTSILSPRRRSLSSLIPRVRYMRAIRRPVWGVPDFYLDLALFRTNRRLEEKCWIHVHHSLERLTLRFFCATWGLRISFYTKFSIGRHLFLWFESMIFHATFCWNKLTTGANFKSLFLKIFYSLLICEGVMARTQKDYLLLEWS